ncbi:MAG: SHOCT domain-containing protein [Candidatus Odinarchaeota archaeon]
MSEVVKIGYRVFGGFIAFIVLFSIGVTGFALTLAGGLVLALSWVPFAYPELLTDQVITVGSSWAPITDPAVVFVILLIVGLTLLGIGGLLLVGAFLIGKGFLVIDRSLSQAIDGTLHPASDVSPRVSYYKPVRATDKITQLERLAELRNSGVLTEEEFEQEKTLIMKGYS